MSYYVLERENNDSYPLLTWSTVFPSPRLTLLGSINEARIG